MATLPMAWELQAVKYHTSILELADDTTESKLADGSVNPKQTTVRWWYDQWRDENLGPRTGSSLVMVCILCDHVLHKTVLNSGLHQNVCINCSIEH